VTTPLHFSTWRVLPPAGPDFRQKMLCYIDKNDRGAYSFNNVTAKADKDGAITIHFGGCKDDRINCLPISKGWNYTARMYQPRKEILNGSWTFPVPLPVK
jgi:hypothetical protein